MATQLNNANIVHNRTPHSPTHASQRGPRAPTRINYLPRHATSAPTWLQQILASMNCIDQLQESLDLPSPSTGTLWTGLGYSTSQHAHQPIPHGIGTEHPHARFFQRSAGLTPAFDLEFGEQDCSGVRPGLFWERISDFELGLMAFLKPTHEDADPPICAFEPHPDAVVLCELRACSPCRVFQPKWLRV